MFGLLLVQEAAQEDNVNLLGDNFFAWIILALGGALLVGNVLALVRPPEKARSGSLEQAPRGRTIAMAALGGLLVLWGLGTLVV